MSNYTKEKLEYLEVTKGLIREAIVEKGQPVSDADTFRSYAGKIKAIQTASEPVLEQLNITENGTYTPPEGVDGFFVVTVAVPTGTSPDIRYVTFMDDTGTVEYGTKAVAVGDDCADPIARGVFDTPTKESDEEYDYRYDGWSTEPGGEVEADWNKAVVEDKTVYAHFVPCGGTCGDSARWSLSEDRKTLTISGTGTMKNYSAADDRPWQYAVSSIQTIIVLEGITRPGDYAFMNHTAVTSVTFPNGMMLCGNYTLKGCKSLKNFKFPLGHVSTGKFLLDGCSALTNVEISSDITTIGEGTFNNCSSLKSITIPESVTRINVAFTNSGLTSATFVVKTGWKMSYLLGSSTDVSYNTLSNTSSAANLLKTLQTFYTLTRS